MKSAYERAAELLTEGERLRQKRLDTPPVPQWRDPFADTEPAYGGSTMNGQEAPRRKTPYEIEYERLMERDQRHFDRANGVPRPPAEPDETAKRLAAMMFDPNKPQPEFPPDPRINQAAHVLAARMLGKPAPSTSRGASDAEGQE